MESRATSERLVWPILALLTALMFSLTGCDTRLPHRQEAITAFAENKNAFEDLVDLFQRSGLFMVIHGEQRAVVFVRKHGATAQEDLSGPLAENLRAGLEAAAARRIQENPGDEGYTVVPRGSVVGANPSFHIEYIYSTSTPNSPGCDQVVIDDRDGYCAIELDSNWWLSYSWSHY